MKFYRLDDVPRSREQTVFREARLPAVLISLFLLALAAVIIIDAWKNRRVALHAVAAATILFAIPTLWKVVHQFGRRNWLLRIGYGGVMVHIAKRASRREIAAGLISPDEIESIGKSSTQVTIAGRKETHTCLDIVLKQANYSELSAQLNEELARSGRHGAWRIGSRWQYEVVRLVDGRVLRLLWRSPSRHIVPGIQKALESLSRIVEIHVEQWPGEGAESQSSARGRS